MNRVAFAAAFSSGLLFAQSPARAQSAASAAAEQLFQDGKRLLDSGKTHEACEKFAASQEADPGLGTLLHLAMCHEKEGKNASAWAEFNEALAQSTNRGEKDREKFSRDHAQALEKQLHRFVLEMPKRPDGLEIKLDGKPFPAGSLGTALPLDPGDHSIEVRGVHKKPYVQTFHWTAGATTDRVEIPALEDEPATPGGQPAGDRRAEPQKPLIIETTGPDLTKRWVGVGLGALGVAGGVVAGVEFATAMSRQQTSQDLLGRDGAASHEAHTQAVTAQTYGYIFAVGGVVALGVGIFLVATSFGSAPSSRSKSALVLTPTVGRGQGGLSLAGEF